MDYWYSLFRVVTKIDNTSYYELRINTNQNMLICECVRSIYSVYGTLMCEGNKKLDCKG